MAGKFVLVGWVGGWVACPGSGGGSGMSVYVWGWGAGQHIHVGLGAGGMSGFSRRALPLCTKAYNLHACHLHYIFNPFVSHSQHFDIISHHIFNISCIISDLMFKVDIIYSAIFNILLSILYSILRSYF